MKLSLKGKSKVTNTALMAKIGRVLKAVHTETKVKIKTFTSITEDFEGISTDWPVMDDLVTGTVDSKSLMTKTGSGSGLPKGRVVEVYGPESTCKTTLTLQVIAAYQRKGLVCAFIDVEYAFDPAYARRLGVDVEALIVHQPNSAEEALDIVMALAKTGMVALIVVDSVAALDPEAEQDRKSGKTIPGLQARLMSAALRRLTPILGQSKTTVIFINQVRLQIGVMFGNPENTAGGKALKFYASIRIELRRFKVMKKGPKAIGTIIKCKTVKNKVAPPHREAFLTVRFGQGITDVAWPNKADASEDDDE